MSCASANEAVLSSKYAEGRRRGGAHLCDDEFVLHLDPPRELCLPRKLLLGPLALPPNRPHFAFVGKLVPPLDPLSLAQARLLSTLHGRRAAQSAHSRLRR